VKTKLIGIIGGIGPEATIGYYRTLLDTAHLHVERAVAELLS